jgi:hypothetical protein
MPWNDKYWDMLNNLYWTPRYLGFKSIPRDRWRVDGDRVLIPKELIQTSTGPLYFRSRKYDDLKSYLHEQEEILNHVFDLTFAIAGDDVINRVLCKPLGLDDAGPFKSIGREVGERYGWRPQENVTQQDGFFVSPKSLIGVELKLGSKSWPEQVAKYLALMMWEEQGTGARDDLGLLFVVPATALAEHWSDVGLTSSVIDPGFVDRLDRGRLPSRIRSLFEESPEALKDLASRLRLAVVSWGQLRSELVTYVENLDMSKPGDQSLHKLLGGLCDQIDRHGKTGIGRAGELVSSDTGTDQELHEGILTGGDAARLTR